MQEWLKKLWEQLRAAWKNWSMVQKIILGAVVVAVIAGLIFIVTFSSSPSQVRVLDYQFTDEDTLVSSIAYLGSQGIRATNQGGYLMVDNETLAMQASGLLVRDDMIPSGVKPYQFLKEDKWTQTDFERNINLQLAITESLEQHLEALEDIDAAQIQLVIPEKELFSEDQNETTASVVIMAAPGSDISENRNKIEGIVKMIQFSVEGLTEDNITISDHNGLLLNDFAGMEKIDQLELTKRMLKNKRSLEAQYMGQMLSSLQKVFTKSRVDIVNIDIDLSYDQQNVQTREIKPITLIEDNPDTAYSEYEGVASIVASESAGETKWSGTGFSPEGPSGVEGQTSAQYKDLNNLTGTYDSNQKETVYDYNTSEITEEKTPYKINKIAVAVAVDGVWKLEFDEKGNKIFENGTLKREYIEVSEEELDKARQLVEYAIGYNKARGDMVTVQHLTFDRTEQFRLEDEEFLQSKQFQQIMIWLIIGLASIVVAFVIFRVISREMDRRRRLREEELARQHQAMREQALRSAEEEGIEVEMSVQDRARMEMQENAKNMAREHPEDVAQLIRTWLTEE